MLTSGPLSCAGRLQSAPLPRRRQGATPSAARRPSGRSLSTRLSSPKSGQRRQSSMKSVTRTAVMTCRLPSAPSRHRQRWAQRLCWSTCVRGCWLGSACNSFPHGSTGCL
eukprot:127614-Chlamydomonas_euryale.AAC.3